MERCLVVKHNHYPLTHRERAAHRRDRSGSLPTAGENPKGETHEDLGLISYGPGKDFETYSESRFRRKRQFRVVFSGSYIPRPHEFEQSNNVFRVV